MLELHGHGGPVVDGYIECPVHYALFDIRTGHADGAITSQPLRTFPTRVEDDATLSGIEEHQLAGRMLGGHGIIRIRSRAGRSRRGLPGSHGLEDRILRCR